jgi:hypothetical protein
MLDELMGLNKSAPVLTGLLSAVLFGLVTRGRYPYVGLVLAGYVADYGIRCRDKELQVAINRGLPLQPLPK